MSEILISGAAELGIKLNSTQLKQLLAYKNFLQEYNLKVNLTSIVDDDDIYVKHFLDSITILKKLDIKESTRIIDIGTGAGFPGMILKILCPQVNFVLLDSLNKRIKFLNELAKKLEISIGLECIHGRAEEISSPKKNYRGSFDYAVSRAVATLPKLLEYCMPFVKQGGSFIAMKGRNYHEELEQSYKIAKKLKAKIDDITEVKLPHSDIVHSLIVVKKL